MPMGELAALRRRWPGMNPGVRPRRGLMVAVVVLVATAWPQVASASVLAEGAVNASGAHAGRVRPDGSWVFTDSFDQLDLWDGRDPSSRNRVALTPRGFDGRGLRIQIDRGAHFGADFEYDFGRLLGVEPTELWFRYFLRFDEDWYTRSSGKLPGFGGVYGHSGKGGRPSTPSDPGWSARMQFFPTKGDGRVPIGYYVYHLGQATRFGDKLGWNRAGSLVPGEWYCLEGHVRLNTPGRADGLLEGWVDETPAFSRDGLAFRRSREDRIRIESFWVDVYFGGSARAETDLGLSIDELALSDRRIGCGVGGGLGRPVSADVDGDGVDEFIEPADCRRVRCVTVEDAETADSSGPDPVDGWLSLDSQRVGLAVADLDGDAADEVIVPGRCGVSRRCWRGAGVGSGTSEPKGAGPPPGVELVVAADLDGDGRDDLVEKARCEEGSCWWVQTSVDGVLEPPRAVGPAPPVHEVVAGDVDGDGRDDLVYRGACEADGGCWLVLAGGPGSEPEVWGLFDAVDGGLRAVRDTNGDGLADLVFEAPCRAGSCVWVAPSVGDRFEPGHVVAVVGDGERVALGEFLVDDRPDLIVGDRVFRTVIGGALVRDGDDGAFARLPAAAARFRSLWLGRVS